MAPSRITSRCSSSASNEFDRADDFHKPPWPLGDARPQAHCVAYRIRQFGAVERIEVKLIDAVLPQALYLLDGHMGGDHAARFRVVVQTVEAMAQPFGNAKRHNEPRSAIIAESG